MKNIIHIFSKKIWLLWIIFFAIIYLTTDNDLMGMYYIHAVYAFTFVSVGMYYIVFHRMFLLYAVVCFLFSFNGYWPATIAVILVSFEYITKFNSRKHRISDEYTEDDLHLDLTKSLLGSFMEYRDKDFT